MVRPLEDIEAVRALEEYPLAVEALDRARKSPERLGKAVVRAEKAADRLASVGIIDASEHVLLRMRIRHVAEAIEMGFDGYAVDLLEDFPDY